MAPPPILNVRGISIGFGGQPLFTEADLALAPGSRACLIGRNASGKSTLLKILAGQIEADTGERFLQPGATIGYLPQQADPPDAEDVAGFVGTPPGRPAPDAHRVDEMLTRLALDGSARLATLSGGEARRAALARTLIGKPDILLLDEPTNHLDLPTILWLERELAELDAAILTISHDRAFLARTTRRTFWLRRDRILAANVGYRGFDAWAEAKINEEARTAAKLKQKIKAEEHWHTFGITARRKRNQGRLGKLEALRAARQTLLRDLGTTKLTAATGTQSGRLVVDAEHLSKAYDGTTVIADFSTRIMRGDRIGIIGPNGSGKTSLLKLLIGELAPDAGTIRHGSKLAVAHFEQDRQALDPDETLWRTLIPGGGDMIDVNGRPRHLVAYLRDFLFDEKQAKAPVKTLSGGERNRLALAVILARPANLLVLDEPTNDLDMETLDVLEDMLADYDGTLILVTHDRDFLDRIVTSTIALEGDGRAVEYAGGYSATGQAPDTPPPRKQKSAPPKHAKAAPNAATKLSYAEQRELDTLPGKIEQLEAAAAQLESVLADPDLYASDRAAHAEATEKLADVLAAIARAEASWLALEERREALAAKTG